ncbi:MAG: response regulator transcription factor [Burkholderiaceae bacterium]
MIRLILVDDHALIRRGLRDTLSEEADFEIAGEAGDWPQLQKLLAAGATCEVLLLDVNLPGASGLDILRHLAEEGHDIRTLVVSMYPEDQYAVQALQAGAWGYVNKSADTPVLVEAVRTVAQGRKYISPAIAGLLVQRLVTPQATLPHERLSEREQQTLVMIASGRKLSEIAEELGLSPKTVSVYRARLLEKMKLSSNAELTHYAVKHGLVD